MTEKKWDVVFEDRLKEGSKERAEWEEARLEAGAASLLALLDDLTRAGKSNSLLSGRINQKRIGVFGHSFGGMAALIALERDRRIRAGLDQDGWGAAMVALAKDARRNGQAPCGLFFRPRTGDRADADSLFAALPPGTMQATIAAAVPFVHMSFSDVRLLSSGENATGRVDGLRDLAVIRAVTRRFFDQNFGRAAASVQSLPREGFRRSMWRFRGNSTH